MINIDLFDRKDDEELFTTVIEFNKLYQAFPTECASYSYYELWEKSGKTLPLSAWKLFKLDKRVRQWFSEELELELDVNIQKLAKEAAGDKSVAKHQTLASLLNRRKEQEQEENNVIMIYSVIPLTPVERNLENVKVIKTIPKGIKDALIISKGD